MHDEEMAIAVVAIVFGVPMVIITTSIVVKGIVKVMCHWRDVSLKIRLAERGMPAYEIEQVVQAGRVDKMAVPRRNEGVQPVAEKPPKADFALRV